jgi:hypothetical protein
MVEKLRVVVEGEEPERRELTPAEHRLYYERTSSLSPASRAWADRNQHAVVDDRLWQKAIAAHIDSGAEGIPAETPQYWAHIEKRLGIDRGEHSAPTEAPIRSAPTSDDPDGNVHVLKRGEQPRPGTRPIKMTRREYELATDGSLRWETGPHRGKPLGVREYVRRKEIQARSPEWQKLD